MRLTDHPWPGGTHVELRIEVYEHGGRLFTGAVEVRTVPKRYETPYGELSPPTVEPRNIGIDIWRAVRLGELEDEAIVMAQTEDEAIVLRDEDEHAYDRLRAVVNSEEDATPRKGRPSNLTPELLALVIDVYHRTPRKPVLAVQQALQDRGFPGSAADGSVTRGQASKAVARARKSPYWPQQPQQDKE